MAGAPSLASSWLNDLLVTWETSPRRHVILLSDSVFVPPSLFSTPFHRFRTTIRNWFRFPSRPQTGDCKLGKSAHISILLCKIKRQVILNGSKKGEEEAEEGCGKVILFCHMCVYKCQKWQQQPASRTLVTLEGIREGSLKSQDIHRMVNQKRLGKVSNGSREFQDFLNLLLINEMSERSLKINSDISVLSLDFQSLPILKYEEETD